MQQEDITNTSTQRLYTFKICKLSSVWKCERMEVYVSHFCTLSYKYLHGSFIR